MKRVKGSILLAAVFLLLAAGLKVHAAEAGSFYEDLYGVQNSVNQSNITYLEEDYDMDFNGSLDAYREPGEDEEQETQQDQEEQNIIMIAENKGFDIQTQQYVHYVGSTGNIKYYSSLPEGIITNGAISFDMSSRSQYVLYREGEVQEGADVYNILEEGSYILESFDSGNSNITRFPFTIITTKTNELLQFTLPEGFRFVRIIVNEQAVNPPDGKIFHMESDGYYTFEFACEEIGKSYVTKIEKDTVAPILEITGLEGNVARGPVSYHKLTEEVTEIEIKKDGQAISAPYNQTLADYGEYVVNIKDQAGNSTEYKFSIQMYFTMTSMIVFLLLIMIAAGLWGYYKYVKKHLRIR